MIFHTFKDSFFGSKPWTATVIDDDLVEHRLGQYRTLKALIRAIEGMDHPGTIIKRDKHSDC